MAKLRSRSPRFEKKKFVFAHAKRKTVSQKLKESESFLSVLSIFCLTVIGVSYIFQTNSIATSGYEVEDYQNKLEELRNENQNMKNQEAELRSIKNLEEEKGRLCEVNSSEINYVTYTDTAVAMRE
ncbi:MAG: hypothetical protein WCQ96_03410 [Patescibacteria group bacterium]